MLTVLGARHLCHAGKVAAYCGGEAVPEPTGVCVPENVRGVVVAGRAEGLADRRVGVCVDQAAGLRQSVITRRSIAAGVAGLAIG